MKIALSQINCRIGDLTNNSLKIIDSVIRAKEQGADLVVFPELSVCGYPPADLLSYDAFVLRCLDAVDSIAVHCNGIAAIIGSPCFNKAGRGKRLYNAAFLLQNGKVDDVVYKTLLPTYDVFDEYRYFEPAKQLKNIKVKGETVALTICEDIWNIDPDLLYPVNPMDELIKGSPDIMINISASPFAWNRAPERMRVLSENARKYNLPLFYANQFGGHTDLIFDGGSAVLNAEGQLIRQLEPFNEGLLLFDSREIKTSRAIPVMTTVSEFDKYDLIYRALVLGIRDYFSKTGLQKAILGLSGGIDSALSLVLLTEALGPENVWAVMLPGPFSSKHSVADATTLALKLGVRHDLISINKVNSSLLDALDKYFSGMPQGISEENLQARARAIILMGLSNKYGHMLINTSNKSEAAVGYGTLYGDMCGGISIIGDLYKTEVYELSEFINRNDEIIPNNTMTKPPSAELRPDQKDTDSLPDYQILDKVLFQYIEQEKTATQIIESGYDQMLVKRIVDMVNQNEYKRRQSPPALRVSQKAFGTGRRMPIVAKKDEF